MNETKTCFVTTPVTTFDGGDITVMLSMVLEPKALQGNVVNLGNYKDHLCFTVYLVPTATIKDDGISIDFDSVFIPVNDTTERQFMNMLCKVEESIIYYLTDDSDDVDDMLEMIVSKIDEVKEFTAEMFDQEVQAYLTRE